ncbi:DUF6528 family protein [Streptomyces sp. NPDC002130]|uniref:DUF6528 family protein n=1 Tax=Streptomyces sp. NPDC002130 TaxID=3155568 RepID=UPI003331E7F5
MAAALLIAPSSAAAAAASDADGKTPRPVWSSVHSPKAQSGPRNLIKRLADTYVSSTHQTDHSQGAFLHVGTPDNGATKYRSFLRFDTSKLTGAKISKAYLRVYNAFVSDCNAQAWMGVYRVTEPWDQSTINWSNQPTVATQGAVGTWFGKFGHPSCEDQPNDRLPHLSDGIEYIDVTEMVQDWVRPDTTTPNYGIRLSAAETGTSGYKDFCSMNPKAAGADRACDRAYFTPTLEVEFNAGATPLIAGTEYGPPYASGYPAAEEALEFLDSKSPSVWPASKPYQRWLPDAYHGVNDASLKGGAWKGGTSHKLRPGGVYGDQVLVTGDGGSGFIGVIPYPQLSGYHWAINVNSPWPDGTDQVTGDLHGVELLPDGNVAAAFANRKGGYIALYTRAQGTATGSWSNSPKQRILLGQAHELTYDPDGGYLWALGGKELRRYTYVNGALDTRAGNVKVFPLPKQEPSGDAWGHDLTPVYGNSDRLWVAANGGIAQFSKSGQAVCNLGTASGRWPTLARANEIENGTKHWCTDYPHEDRINVQPMVKSIGNDPVTGKVATTCADSCELANTHYEKDANGNEVLKRDYHTSWIEIVGSDGVRSAFRWSEHSKHYKATWGAPAYR